MDEKQTLELEIKTSIDKGLEAINNLSKGIEGLNGKLDKAINTTNKFGSVFKTAFSLATVKKFGKEILSFLDNSINRAEELNLFNVVFKNVYKEGKETFSELGKEATKFQNRLNEAFGTNKTETMRYQGLFQSMAENVGIKSEYAMIMSENMTKMTYDLASLYNKSEKTTAEAIRAGVYAGQTKPLRNFGIDVTQTSLTPILNQIGITDRTISQMSMAEKEILRYIAVLNQGKIAMGDFADTIESPANQLKVFKNQIAEVKVAIGNLFMGLFSNILPYANAILMVIKEIAKAIAMMFGIETRDYNTGLASLEEVYDGIGDSAGKAGKATKELKRQILGFDQINNLTTPSNNGNGSGGASGFGSIDKRLIDYIKGYDNLMGEVQMKATKIRDRIMEWLGFTKHVNEETDEVYFKFEKLTGGTVLGGLAVGGIIFTGIMKIVNALKGLGTIFSIFKGTTATSGLVSSLVSNVTATSKLKELLGLAKGKSVGYTLTKTLGGSAVGAGAKGGLASIFGGASAGAIASTLGLVLAVVGAVVTLVASLKRAWKESEEFRNAFNSAWDSVKNLFTKIGSLVEKVATTIAKVLEPAWKVLKKTIDWVTDTVYENIRFKYEALFEFISGVCDTIVLLIDGDIIGAYKRWGETVDTVGETMRKGYAKIIVNTITSAKEIITTIWKEIVEKIPTIIANIDNKIYDFLFKTIPEKIGLFIGKVGLSIGKLVTVIFTTDWEDVGKKILDKIFNSLSDIKDKIKTWAENLAKKMEKAFQKGSNEGGSAWDGLKQVGKLIAEAILAGMAFPVATLIKKGQDIGTSFLTGIRKGLGIKDTPTSVGSAIVKAVEALVGVKAGGGIFSSGYWRSIPQYANGGSPHGTMFVAGERGAEIVGNINGRTEVLNKSQIASSIYSAVLSAMSQSNFGGGQIDVHVHTDEGTVVDRINQKTKQTGRCPINIPA